MENNKGPQESRWTEGMERDLRAGIASETAMKGQPALILSTAIKGTGNDVAGILAGERFKKEEEK